VSAIAFVAVKLGIQEWVQAGSGLPDARVIWNLQGGARPKSPCILMSIQSVAGVGDDWIVHEVRNPPVVGEEIRRKAQGHRIATLELQCFAAEETGDTSTPILTDVISSLALHVDDLDIAGVGVGSVGPVRSVPGTRGGILEPRSVVEIEIHLASEVARYLDSIDSVEFAANASP
jgi:hypothetical protein